MRVSSVSEMRDMDARAIRDFGIPEELLMENAGIAAAGVVRAIADSRWGSIRGRRVAVICGIGSNGGDGLVVTRCLHSAGAAVSAIVVGDPEGYRGAARIAWGAASRLGLAVRSGAAAEQIGRALLGSDVVVDALFGTGLSRAVEGVHFEAVSAMNSAAAAGAIVVSLDIPSGVHGDSGAVLGAAVRARHTVTFGLPKIGCLLYPGYAYCGKLWLSHISFPPELYEQDRTVAAVNDPVPLPPRPPDGYKGTFGNALFVAGSRGYLGAPVLAAMAHLRGGGGYARLAVPGSLVAVLAGSAPEAVFVPQPETGTGSIAASGLDALLELARVTDMTVVGPGLSLDPEAGQVATTLIREVKGPVVVDGDGLGHLARSPEAVRNREGPLVLTPHPGELARLLGKSVAEVMEKRVESLREAVSRYRAVVVAKGAHTLVGLRDGRIFVNMSGNSGMATAGSGDVLAGAIPAMLGLGLCLEDAVRTGVFLHGLAGDLAAAALGEDGITASDILERLPNAVRKLREEREVLCRDCYGVITMAP